MGQAKYNFQTARERFVWAWVGDLVDQRELLIKPLGNRIGLVRRWARPNKISKQPLNFSFGLGLGT